MAYKDINGLDLRPGLYMFAKEDFPDWFGVVFKVDDQMSYLIVSSKVYWHPPNWHSRFMYPVGTLCSFYLSNLSRISEKELALKKQDYSTQQDFNVFNYNFKEIK